jgi:hypothetical protein
MLGYSGARAQTGCRQSLLLASPLANERTGRGWARAPPRRRLELRRSSFRVEVHKLERVGERQVRELAGRVSGEPQCSALYCASKAEVGVGLRGHERMFSRPEPHLL